MRTVFLFFILCFGLAKSQSTIVNISNNTDNLLINNISPTILTSDKNVIISGKLLSDTQFIVRPHKLNSIIIRPAQSLNQTSKFEEGDYTTIGRGKGGTGRITIAVNPVPDKLSIIIEGTEMNGYKIMGMNGTIYKQNDSVEPTNQYEINVADLPSGNYILAVMTTSGKTLSENFIKL